MLYEVITLRGDCNGDGDIRGVADALYLLENNFISTKTDMPCLAACDVNANGEVSGVQDALEMLTHNFLGGVVIPPPFPECGPSELESDHQLV